jgi:catechol 2,3-dioxygenase-like lactoylglutathione lyase family enzyme
LHGHQIVAHWAGNDYRCQDYYNPVDGTYAAFVVGQTRFLGDTYVLHIQSILTIGFIHSFATVLYYLFVMSGDEVPVPHAGLALTVEQWHDLAQRLRDHGVGFIIEPHLRFEGQPGEQYTMFFKDPSGNNLEFKAMTKVENLFAKYNVADDPETK